MFLFLLSPPLSYLAVIYFPPFLPFSFFHSLNLPAFWLTTSHSSVAFFLISFPLSLQKERGPLLDLPQVYCPSTPQSPPPLLPSLTHSSQPAPDKKGVEVFLFGHFWNWSHQRRMTGNKNFFFFPGSLTSISVIFHLNAACH